MLTSSAKQKGRLLQQYVAARIIYFFPNLKKDDVISKSMGAGGEDIVLSTEARRLLPISVECKSKKAIAIYKDYYQCEDNADIHQPILVVKQNNSRPLAIMDLDYYISLLERINNEKEKAEAQKKSNS